MRLLLVEDYGPLRDSLACGLRQAGYAVDAAADGSEGWWRLQTATYDLAILDRMLPGIDGLELLRRLRAAGQTVRVLLLTARDGVEERVAGLDAGADDYLVKPFAVPELLARLRSLLRRSSGKPAPVLELADLRLDPAARSVSRGGEPVALGPREYQLLEVLLRRQGEVVSRSELWEHLYDFAAENISNVLDVLVGRLRRKLQRDGAPELIHTRRGHGYVAALPE